MFVVGIYRGMEYELLRRGEGPFVVAKTYYAVAYRGSLFAAVD